VKRVVPFLILSLAAVACATSSTSEEDEDEAVASDDAALTAFENEVGFDGAIARLDEATLEKIDVESKAQEANGIDEATLDRTATKRVLTEAKKRPKPATTQTRAATGTRPQSIRIQGVYDSDLFNLNSQEQALCKSARLKCVRVALAGLRARAASQSEYDDGNVGGRIDAFRHTYWNALMTESVGATHAKKWADAHENGYPDNRATAEARLLSDMDFFNNAEGRKIGDREGNSKDQVREALKTGQLKAIRYTASQPIGILVPSSECTATVLCGK